jgi:hypothetical protein
VPHGHWQTSTFIAALRRDRIDAPFLIEGSANMEVFAAYVGRNVLAAITPLWLYGVLGTFAVSCAALAAIGAATYRALSLGCPTS